MFFRHFLPEIDYPAFKIAKLQAELQKKAGYAALQIVGGSALAVYSWKRTDYGWWTTAFPMAGLAIGLVGAYKFYSSMRKYFTLMPTYPRRRMKSTLEMSVGVIMYFGCVWTLSENLKDDSILWMPSLGVSAAAYYLAVTAVNNFGETFPNRKPFSKFCELMVGPTLSACAAFYLWGIQDHQEDWLIYFPLLTSFLAGHHILYRGIKRLRCLIEPRWLLFKGMESMVGGCIVTISSVVLSFCAINDYFHPVLRAFFYSNVFWGLIEMVPALQAFQQYMYKPEYVVYNISFMIGGPIIISSVCLIVKFVDNIFNLPLFIFLAGTGVSLFGIGVHDLYVQSHRRDFRIRCQMTLGPTCFVYGTLASVYLGYHKGWRFSLATAPFVAHGMYLTWKGFSHAYDLRRYIFWR